MFDTEVGPQMTFSELRVGDHFIWPMAQGEVSPDSVNVQVKIAWSEEGGGFAIVLATRLDSVDPATLGEAEMPSWILGSALVIKLNGTL
jgi:hypothetical protein